MTRIADFLKKNVLEHWPIIVLGFLMTLLVSAPILVFPRVAGDRYQGINIAHFGTDEYYYLARGKEILEGHGLGQAILREGKMFQDPTFTYVEHLMLGPVKLLGLENKIDIVTIYNVYNLFGVFILILLVYGVAFSMSASRLFSAAAALFVIGGYSIIYNKGLFYDDFNAYGRTLYPYVSSLGLFAYLGLLHRSLKENRKILSVSAGLVFGLLFYVYFYAWTFTAAFTAILVLFYLIAKDYDRAKSVGLTFVIGFLVGGLLVAGLLKFFSSDVGRQLSYFFHSLKSQQFVMSKIGLATLVFFLWFSYKRPNDQNRIFILAIIFAGWLSLNQQIVTGRLVQYGHYYWYFVVPLSIIVGCYMIWSIKPESKVTAGFLWFLIAVAFLNTAVGQYRSIVADLAGKLYEQKYAPSLNLLKNRPASVVLTADDGVGYPFLVNIYTNDDLFWNSAAVLYYTPISRLKEALFVYSYLNRDARNNFSGYLKKSLNESKGDGQMIADLYRFIEGYEAGVDYYQYFEMTKIGNNQKIAEVRAWLLPALSAEYRLFSSNRRNVVGLLKKYGVGYVLWDEERFPNWDLTALGPLKALGPKGSVNLYEF
jgi:hypothetical protein